MPSKKGISISYASSGQVTPSTLFCQVSPPRRHTRCVQQLRVPCSGRSFQANMIRVDLVGGCKWFRWDSLPPQSQPLYLCTYMSFIHITLSYLQDTFANQDTTSIHKPQTYVILSVSIPICTNTDIKFTPNDQWTKWCPNMLWLSVPQQMCDGMQAAKTCCLTSTSLIAGYAQLIHLLIRKWNLEPKHGPFEQYIPAFETKNC